MSTIGIASSGNTLTVNGKTANAVNSVSGSVSGNTLNLDVNGVAGQVTLPTNEKTLSSKPLSDFIIGTGPTLGIMKEFDIEYIIMDNNVLYYGRTTVSKGIFSFSQNSHTAYYGTTYISPTSVSATGYIYNANGGSVARIIREGEHLPTQLTTESIPSSTPDEQYFYRLFE